MSRPTYVSCAGPCKRDRVDARTTREAVVVWVLNMSGKGGTEGAAGHIHTTVYLCRECWREKVLNDPPEVAILAQRLATVVRDIVTFIVPRDDKQRDLFGAVEERKGA